MWSSGDGTKKSDDIIERPLKGYKAVKDAPAIKIRDEFLIISLNERWSLGILSIFKQRRV